MSIRYIRSTRSWIVFWGVVLSGGIGYLATLGLERWPAAQAVPIPRRLLAAGFWGVAWTALTGGWWINTFYNAGGALLGMYHPWPRFGNFALLGGWVFWTLLLWAVLPLTRAWLRMPGDPVPETPFPAAVVRPPMQVSNGTDIGCNAKGQAVVITDEELNTHLLVVGASGSGKTNALLLLAASALRRKRPLVFIDGKGSGDLRRRLESLATAAGRPMLTWSVSGSTYYNPLRYGGPTELRDKIIESEVWTEPHYRRAAENYLGELLLCMKSTGTPVTLSRVAELLVPSALKALARTLGDQSESQRLTAYLTNLDESTRSAVAGLANRLGTLVRSEAGPWLTAGSPEIDLLDVATNGGVVLFSLDALRFPGLVSQMSALLLLDLRTVASRLIENGSTLPCYVIIDEFTAFDGAQVLALLNKGREAGLCCVLATQDLSDVEKAGGPAFVNQVVANTNVKLTLRQDVGTSAQLLSASVGTRPVWRKTHATDGGGPTGLGSLREFEEPILDPNLLKRLTPHEAVLVRKAPTWAVERVRLRKAE